MLFCVPLQIVPQFVGQDIFLVDLGFGSSREGSLRFFATVLRMEDVGECRGLLWQFEFVPRELCWLAKPDDKDSFPMLRNEVCGIDDFAMHFVPKLVFECLANDFEGLPLTMAEQVFDVFKQEGGGAMVFDNSRHLEEQRALSFALEAMRRAE